MHFIKLKYIFPAAFAVVASTIFVAPQSALAIPVAPAPGFDNSITDVQYRQRGGGGGGMRAARPAARPMGRPGVRPNMGIRPGVGVRPGRPVAVAPGFRPGVRPGYTGVRPGYPGVRPGYPGYRPGVRPVVRPGYYGNWYRPYRWGPGGALAAGAAIGVIGAVAAASYYGQPPAPGLCWYYTDPSRSRGFWDVCPY